jgi:predicted RNase H-like HicB family nuclease
MDLPIKLVVHRAEEGGYWAEVPALPGCVTEGETLDDLFRNAREAVSGWLETSQERSLPNAPASDRGEVVTL